jgi:hypothetical protein
MLSRNSTRNIKTLSIAYKVRFMVWQEEGMSTNAVANCSGRHCTVLQKVPPDGSKNLRKETIT